MRPNTIESGILSTKRNRPVSTSMLTRMLVPKPKNAFQSPGVQIVGLKLVDDVLMCGSPLFQTQALPRAAVLLARDSATSVLAESETQPKMPPCALIIFRPISWNSGK